MDVDQALQKLGKWGRWQTSFYILLCVTSTFPAVWHMLAIVFLGGIPTHTCKTHRSHLNSTIPRLQTSVEQNDGYERCTKYKNLSISNDTEPCTDGWTYWDSEGIGPTIVSQFGLVCDWDYLKDGAQTIMVWGVLVGAMLFTALSDNFGRKPVFLFSQWAMVVVGVATAFTNSYYSFATFRFFTGMLQQGILLTGFIMACELFPASQRTVAGLAIELFWAAGMCLEALFGYLIRDWKYFQLAITLPWVLTIALFWVLPESIPWLCVNERVDQAEKILLKAAKINKVVIPGHVLGNDHGEQVTLQETSDKKVAPPADGQAVKSEQAEKKNKEGFLQRLCNRFRSKKSDNGSTPTTKHYTLLDVLKNRKLRIWALIMSLLWFVNTLVYYGLSLSTSELAGNRYLNFFFSALIEVPAYGSSIFILEKWGRRRPLFFYHILAGVALMVMIFIPSKTSSGTSLQPLIMTFSMIGKFGITSSFGTVFLYAPEIFPTTLRSQAMGIASVGGRFGNMIAPFSAYVARKVFWLPGLIFGVLSIVVGLLALLLPETLNRPLPQTIEDIESWSQNPPSIKGDDIIDSDEKKLPPHNSSPDQASHSNDVTKTTELDESTT